MSKIFFFDVAAALNMRVWFRRERERRKKMFHIRWFLLLIPNFNIASQYTSSKSLFLLLFLRRSTMYVSAIPLSDMSEERKRRSWFVDAQERRRKMRRRFFFLSPLRRRRRKSLTEMNQWKIFFCSFSLSFSLSNHSKLSWSMMMVGSALSFDLDASRLIYTSNTWHFSREDTRKTDIDDFRFRLAHSYKNFLQYGTRRNEQEIIHQYWYVRNAFPLA